MIDQADRRLKDWVKTVLGTAEVSLAPPGQSPQGVSLYLMDLAEAPVARGAGRSPLQLALRYLVTTSAEEPEDAHRMLGELVFAAMADQDLEVDLQPLPAATWAAFGVAPLPAFVLCVPLRRERPEPPIRFVRAPLVVQVGMMASLHGKVLGPRDVPLVGARVELPALQLSELTDTDGRFYFAAVPREPRQKQLRVRAKGREQHLIAEQPKSDGEPLVIHFNLEE